MAMHRLCTGYAQAMHRRHTTLLLPERLPTTLLLPEGCPMGGTFILLLSEWCAFPEVNGFDPVRKLMIPFCPKGIDSSGLVHLGAQPRSLGSAA